MFKVTISGPMAVGKTTIIKKIIENNNNAYAIFENAVANNQLFNSICKRESSILTLDFKQLIYIYDIIERKEKADKDILIFDKGLEDIIFYWNRELELNYNDIKNKSILPIIKNQINNEFSNLIIYLDANDKLLYSRKKNDKSRSRNFFDKYMKNFRDEEKKYFKSLNAHFIDTDLLTIDEIAKQIEDIIYRKIE
ncbi:MAG: hypothetical protein EOL97_01785 [Spirochaetia bacterium]|nr:hypothetical protein [Spirochaetia bacterium]